MSKGIKHIRLHPEEPIEVVGAGDEIFQHDKLGFKDSVIRLSDVMQNIETPFTLGFSEVGEAEKHPLCGSLKNALK